MELTKVLEVVNFRFQTLPRHNFMTAITQIEMEENNSCTHLELSVSVNESSSDTTFELLLCLTYLFGRAFAMAGYVVPKFMSI